MSVKENPCRKFQANIFNKSKCQNCFKPRESHLLNDEDLNQAKPIYGGWLLLAPEGTNFDNPLHRSRKWQRRFFILYEHGLLRYALDEMPSTLPQGTINMNQCSDVIDGESRTGQKNSLCILTPDKEHFIRAECKEIINGWQEALTVYPRTNKQNQKKKRKVDPPTQQSQFDLSSSLPLLPSQTPVQEPGPAKVTVTSGGGSGGSIPCLPSSIASAERVPMSRATLWQEENRWSRATIPCSRSASCLSQLGQSQPDSTVTSQDDGGMMSTGRKVRVESGYFSLEKTKSEPSPKSAQNSQPPQQLPLSSSTSSCSLGASGHRRSQVIGRFKEERMDTCGSSEPSSDVTRVQRQGRSERRYLAFKPDTSSSEAGNERSVPDVSVSTFANLRRAKSLDRRVTESSMTPDLLNFKKGWMTKLYEDGMWKKHWFVLTDQSLRYYKDSIAEEASEVDGEIDLSTCYDVKEFPVQRNYGFQILCAEGACTLSAMTSGIRRNWIQAIMKNARPTVAPDVTRKNISLKLSVLKPRSFSEEKIQTQVLLEPCQQVKPETSPCPSGPPDPDGPRQPTDNGASTPPSEARKSRVRERRREGRSKTFDWSEFKTEKKDKPVNERADTVDHGSSLSTTASRCSVSSSPVSTSVLQTHRVSDAYPASTTEDNTSHLPNPVLVTSTLNTVSPAQPSLPDRQEQGGMEVDRNEDGSSPTSGVKEEIEQRWHQVETTPLREEKQVPISSTTHNSDADRLPAHELAALLDKELGQKQKELDQLQRQNNLLKEQLEDALGREQSARDGYVLQSATPPTFSPWQHLHKLNQDLQGELESQKRKQDLAHQQIKTLKRSYTQAQSAADRHEADIEALQSKLASALAEISASEQAVARMRNELKLEQERSKEQEEEYGRGEATLRAQLKDSESRLREVEASLLERNQALRQLEHQQALQRDHVREIQRLQDKLQEVTARLAATEEGQALKDERLRKEQLGLQESHERERQNLCRRLAEAESTQKEMEVRLGEAQQQVEALLRGRRGSAAMERNEELLKLQEELTQKSNTSEALRESVRRLEEERALLTRRCQELLNQIAEADREVNKLRERLRGEEADYCSLENSYERATREFQRISQFLREKEEEIRQTKETYERLMKRKEEDLKEALVKMTALGNSLEETEQKLQAKEDLLCRMTQPVEPGGAEQNLKAKLAFAENRIAELERHLDALQLGYADLQLRRKHVQEQSPRGSLIPDEESPPSKTEDADEESRAKKPRIRFSNIQCQKYNDDVNQTDFDSTPALSSPDTAFPHPSDSEKFISIVRALETKLLATEEKLKNLTRNLQERRSTHAEDQKMVQKEPLGCDDGGGPQITDPYAKALLCVETSRQKVKAFLSGSHDNSESQLQSLSQVEKELFSASAYIRHGQKTLEELSPCGPQTQTAEALDQDAIHLFAKTLSFEALVLNKMASLLQTSESDLLQTLSAVWEDAEDIRSADCLAIVYADVLSRKLTLEAELRKEPEKEATPRDGAKSQDVTAEPDVNATAVFNSFIKAEVSYSIQNLKLGYEEKVRLLQGQLAEAHRKLRERETALKAIIDASKRSDLKNVIKEVKSNFGSGKQKLADICPPELAPYAEQIQSQEARDLAEKIVERHLDGVDSAESLQSAHRGLAAELRQQAAKLHEYAQEIQNTKKHPELAKMLSALFGPGTSHLFTSTSLCMREALIQAQVAYVACRLRWAHRRNVARCERTQQSMDALVQQHARSVRAIQEKYQTSLQRERHHLEQALEQLQKESATLKEEVGQRSTQLSKQQEQLAQLGEHFQIQVEELEQKHREELRRVDKDHAATELALSEAAADSRQQLKDLLADVDAMKERHHSHVKTIQADFEQRIAELRRIYEDQIVTVRSPMEEEEEGGAAKSEGQTVVLLRDRIQELETQMNTMRDELESKHLEGDVASLRVKYQRDLESLKATCERGFAAMEETHHKVVEDLQRQHQREISKLMEERERLLAEETAATIAAIEAMKNAHKEELEKNQRSQLSGLNSDIDELRLQYEEELQSIQRELEVLSEQYSQKCLENAHLAQALEAERQALRQCQRENQELNTHNQELNNRLSAEITRMRSSFSGETALSPTTQGKDVYELEVLLRIKESEIQYLKQEIHSLKDELQSALRDKKYTTDKYKDIYTELSIVKAKADCDIGKLKEKLLIATEALGERSVDGTVTSGYDIMKSKSNPDFTKKEQTTTSKPSRGVRSKSLKEGLSVQERMKLFEAKDSKNI
ncbi:trichohyalin isoform X5 [Syngnathus scovelli]|uniref:trichohyalin isoform X5 n=1 Tax=Syngnathus scovelli TaxID=161590 RepID=UPI002110DB7F|nr:early endosome antigen 1 isoform X5 [Syngnathus scovelli]